MVRGKHAVPPAKKSNQNWRARNDGSVFADVFVPDGGIFLDVVGEERYTFLRVQVDDFDVESAEPINAALKGARFANDDPGKTELANQAAAIPAGSERGDHGEFAIAALAAGVAEGVGFSVERRIAELHAAIVPGAEERAVVIEDGGADGDAAFGKSFAGFGERNGQRGAMIETVFHCRNYTRTEFPMASKKSPATLSLRTTRRCQC